MSNPTVHLVYPHGPSSACPHAIGTRLGERLRRQGPVVHYDLTHPGPIHPAPGDVLIGHPDAAYWSVVRASLPDPRWRRRLLMAPFTHGDLRQCAYIDPLMPACDLFLAITGGYWVETLPRSALAHWGPKLVHLDLAVEPADFPPLKTTFNPPGKRRLVYIGHAGWYKNLPYLAALAQRLPQYAFHWIGDPSTSFPGLINVGRQDFSQSAARELVATYDLLITVGTADPNPTTILEAMAWGLIPVCTRESGYHAERGVINLPLGDLAGSAAVIEGLQRQPESELQELQAHNRRRLAEHYHWDRFAAVVSAAIASDASPPLLPRSLGNRLEVRAAALRAPQSGLRFQHLRRAILRRLGRRRGAHPCAVPAHCGSPPHPSVLI